jgi:tagatose 6-phosphate kinase
VSRFLADFDRELAGADVVTISGSIPEGAPEEIYSDLISRCRQAGIPVLVDTSGARLISAVKEKPSFIKPNEDEIAQLTGRSFSGREEAVRALMELHDGGIPYVVLSLGAEGALLACDKGVFHGKPPKITPRNTVGCGDSMVAGFAVGFARHLSMAETFRMALAVSAASALSLFTGDFDPADYDRLYPEVSIDKVF